MEAAKSCIDSILNLIVERCEKGIRDRDPNIRTNFGFIDENQAIELDLGSYTKDESLKTPQACQTALLNDTEIFQAWLAEQSPELSEYLTRNIYGKIN